MTGLNSLALRKGKDKPVQAEDRLQEERLGMETQLLDWLAIASYLGFASFIAWRVIVTD